MQDSHSSSNAPVPSLEQQGNEELTCPACRARQEPGNLCRRCGAELELYIACLRSRTIAQRLHSSAVHSGDSATAERLMAYLNWLG